VIVEAPPRPAAAPEAGIGRALRRPAVVVPAAISVVAAVALLLAPGDDLARTLPVEDAYYALSVARQAAIGGGITIDGETATNGFQPLWVALNVPLYALVDGDRIAGLRLSQVFSTLLWLAFAALLATYARDLARRHGLAGGVAAAAAAIVAIGSVSVLRLFRNGLETGLMLVLLVAAVILLDRWTSWTPRRVALAGVLLGALAWARLDAAMFAVAFAAVALWRSRRAAPRRGDGGTRRSGSLSTGGGTRRSGGLLPRPSRGAVAPLAACALAALVLVPWLAYNVALDGSPMPSGGQAQARAHNLPHNVDSALRAVGSWTLAPVLRASMHTRNVPWVELAAAAGIALALLAVVFVRRGRRDPLGAGTVALALYVGFLIAWYVLAFGAWWFLDRYLAPVLVLALPWLACALERFARDRRWPLPALATVVVAANVPLLALLVSSPNWPPPEWSSRSSNLGSHLNLNHVFQLAWTREHVLPGCRVGAFESGTLGYFRDDVVNLDGKVNPDALQAKLDRRSPEYVERAGIDVLIDIEAGIRRADAGGRGWSFVIDEGRFEAWVRPGAERCVR
jgi:hypothetical protein